MQRRLILRHSLTTRSTPNPSQGRRALVSFRPRPGDTCLSTANRNSSRPAHTSILIPDPEIRQPEFQHSCISQAHRPKDATLRPCSALDSRCARRRCEGVNVDCLYDHETLLPRRPRRPPTGPSPPQRVGSRPRSRVAFIAVPANGSSTSERDRRRSHATCGNTPGRPCLDSTPG